MIELNLQAKQLVEERREKQRKEMDELIAELKIKEAQRKAYKPPEAFIYISIS